MTPTEVGILLKALGYPESTPIYIAAGEIYGGDDRMAGLLSRFPNVMRKVSLFVNHSGTRLLKEHGSWNELLSFKLYVLCAGWLNEIECWTF